MMYSKKWSSPANSPRRTWLYLWTAMSKVLSMQDEDRNEDHSDASLRLNDSRVLGGPDARTRGIKRSKARRARRKETITEAGMKISLILMWRQVYVIAQQIPMGMIIPYPWIVYLKLEIRLGGMMVNIRRGRESLENKPLGKIRQMQTGLSLIKDHMSKT